MRGIILSVVNVPEYCSLEYSHTSDLGGSVYPRQLSINGSFRASHSRPLGVLIPAKAEARTPVVIGTIAMESQIFHGPPKSSVVILLQIT